MIYFETQNLFWLNWTSKRICFYIIYFYVVHFNETIYKSIALNYHALEHFAKHHVLPIQGWRGCRGDKELWPIGVLSRVRHGQPAGTIVMQLEVLVFEGLAVYGLALKMVKTYIHFHINCVIINIFILSITCLYVTWYRLAKCNRKARMQYVFFLARRHSII